MPRRIALSWPDKVEVYRSFRKLGKGYPVALDRGVARSTVRSILGEFEDAGFSMQPRLRLSQETMALLQARHLDEVHGDIQKAQNLDVLQPRSLGSVALAGQAYRGAGILTLPEPVPWHLKGTPASALFDEASQAVDQYSEDCVALRTAVRHAIESRCGVTVEEYYGVQFPVVRSYLWSWVVDFEYEALFGRLLPPPEEWRDDPAPEQPSPPIARIRCGVTEVGLGFTSDLNCFRTGVRQYLDQDKAKLVERAKPLTQRYDDLLYLVPVVHEAFIQVSMDMVTAGVCPRCPYPEAQAEAAPTWRGRRKSAQSP